MIKSFILYLDLGPTIQELRDAEAGRLIKAVYAYVSTGALPQNLKGGGKVCFDVIRNALDRDIAKYELKRKQQSEAGRKGGKALQAKLHAQADSLQSAKATPDFALANQANNRNININRNTNRNKNENINLNIPSDSCREDGLSSAQVNSPTLYGRYQNIPLTEQEYRELREEFPQDYMERIERLSEYTASSGKQYANALATIRSWARKEKEETYGKPEHNPYDALVDALGTVL